MLKEIPESLSKLEKFSNLIKITEKNEAVPPSLYFMDFILLFSSSLSY